MPSHSHTLEEKKTNNTQIDRKNIPAKDVSKSLYCQQMRRPWWFCSRLSAFPSCHFMPWYCRKWLVFSGCKKACNKDFAWRDLQNHNFHVLSTCQDLSYLTSSSQSYYQGYLYQRNLAFSSGTGGEQKKRYNSINRRDFTIFYTGIHFPTPLTPTPAKKCFKKLSRCYVTL